MVKFPKLSVINLIFVLKNTKLKGVFSKNRNIIFNDRI